MSFDHPADIPREQYLRTELELLHEELGQMVERGSWQALVAGRRLALQYRNEIDALKATKAADAFDPTSIDDVVSEVAKLPDAVFAHPDIVARVAECHRAH